MDITFNELPQFVSKIYQKLENMEKLLTQKKKEPGQDQIMSAEECAAFLRLKVTTIYGLVSKGKIPKIKKGKLIYFSKKDIEAWLLSGKVKTPQEVAAEADQFLSKK